METNYQDRIDLYLSGQMPFVDRFNFEAELESNPELKEMYDFTLLLQDELWDRHRKKETIENWKKESDDQLSDKWDNTDVGEPFYPPLISKKKIWYRRIGWAAAAIFLILLFITIPDSKHRDGKEIAEVDAVEASHSNQSKLRQGQVMEVSSQDLVAPVEKLTIKQQKIYWERALYQKSHGQRDDCIKTLRILLQQDGVYRDKADSLLLEIYQTQK